MLAGFALGPRSVWLELSPVRRPSIRWQVGSGGGGGGAATGKLQSLHHKKRRRVMSSRFNGVKGLQCEQLIGLSLSVSTRGAEIEGAAAGRSRCPAWHHRGLAGEEGKETERGSE